LALYASTTGQLRHDRQVMDLVDQLNGMIIELTAARPRVLVGVDGPDAAGKTTLGTALAERLPHPVLRASVDDFHQPRAVRRRRGELSAEGYYRDAFDYAALTGQLLAPFRDGAATVMTQWFDYRADQPTDTPPVAVPTRAVLVVDGVFLQRPELRDYWTLTVYLAVSADESLSRGVARDLDLWTSATEAERRYRQRYLAGQALYRVEVDPEANADILIDNETPTAPTIRRALRR
jgi:uridine kinase